MLFIAKSSNIVRHSTPRHLRKRIAFIRDLILRGWCNGANPDQVQDGGIYGLEGKKLISINRLNDKTIKVTYFFMTNELKE